MNYNIYVIGQLWLGYQSAYHKCLNICPNNPQEVKKYFGDFESIDDYRIVTVSRNTVQEGNKTTTTIVEELIKDWSNDDSAELYWAATGK